jgi:hypothetical protein
MAPGLGPVCARFFPKLCRWSVAQNGVELFPLYL